MGQRKKIVMLDIKVQLTDNIKGRIELNNYKSNSIMNNFQAISESRRKKKIVGSCYEN